MPRSAVWTLYAGCVLVWSSTWVVIAVGLDGVDSAADVPHPGVPGFLGGP